MIKISNILKVLCSEDINRNQDLPNATSKKQSPPDIIKQIFAQLIARFSEDRKDIFGLNNMWCLSHEIDPQQLLLYISDCSFLLVHSARPRSSLNFKDEVEMDHFLCICYHF